MQSLSRHPLHPMPERALRGPTHASTLTRARNQPFFLQGDAEGAIYQVQSGCIRLQIITLGGRRCITGFRHVGDFFGLGLQGPSQVDAEAVVPSCVTKLCRNGFSALLTRHRDQGLAVLDAAYGGQEPLAQLLVTISQATAEQRLVWFLMTLGERLGVAVGSQHIVPLPMMRGDIADHLGLTFETVSREMTKLRDRGIISFNGPRQFRITAPNTLKSLAQSVSPPGRAPVCHTYSAGSEPNIAHPAFG